MIVGRIRETGENKRKFTRGRDGRKNLGLGGFKLIPPKQIFLEADLPPPP